MNTPMSLDGRPHRPKRAISLALAAVLGAACVAPLTGCTPRAQVVRPEAATPAPWPTPILRTGEVPVVAAGEHGGVRAWRVGDLLVLHKPVSSNDVVAAQLYFAGGTARLTPETSGIERLALQVAAEGGTRTTARDAFHGRLDAMGSSIAAFVESDYAGMGMQSTAEAFESTWELFEQAVMEPAMPPSEIEVQRARQLADIDALFDDADSHVSYVATRLLFGTHPYSNLQLGTRENVSKFSPEELQAWQQSLLTPERMVLVVVGNVPEDALLARVQKSLGRLKEQGLARLDVPSLESAEATADKGTHRLQVEQKELATNYILGLYPAPAPEHPDYPAMVLATRHLSERLFEEVRTKRNLTYAVSAGLSQKRANYGYLYVTAADPGATMPVMFEEVARLKNRPLALDELQEVRNVYITQHYMGLQSNGRQASQLAMAHLLRGDWKRFDRFLADIEAVKPEDLQRVAKTWMHSWHFGVVGNPETVAPAFDGLKDTSK